MMGREMVKQSELARTLDTNQQWVSVRLRGRQPIDLNDLERIAAALGVEVADLMPGPEVKTRKGRTSAYGDRPNGRPDAPTGPPNMNAKVRRPVLNRTRYAA